MFNEEIPKSVLDVLEYVQPMTHEEWEKIKKMLDTIYQDGYNKAKTEYEKSTFILTHLKGLKE